MKGYKLDVVAIVYDSSCVCSAFLPVVDAEICACALESKMRVCSRNVFCSVGGGIHNKCNHAV